MTDLSSVLAARDMRGGVGIERGRKGRAEWFHFFIPAAVTEVSRERRQRSEFYSWPNALICSVSPLGLQLLSWNKLATGMDPKLVRSPKERHVPIGNSTGFAQHMEDGDQDYRKWIELFSQLHLSAVPGDVFRVHLQVYSIIPWWKQKEKPAGLLSLFKFKKCKRKE